MGLKTPIQHSQREATETLLQRYFCIQKLFRNGYFELEVMLAWGMRYESL